MKSKSEVNEVVVNLVEANEVEDWADKVVVLRCPTFQYASDHRRKEHYRK